MQRVCVNIVAVEKQYVLHILSVKKAEDLRGPLEPVENKKTSECVFVVLVIQHA